MTTISPSDDIAKLLSHGRAAVMLNAVFVLAFLVAGVMLLRASADRPVPGPVISSYP